MRRRATTAALLGIVGGCSLAPHYQRPSMPTPPDAYKEAGEWKVAAPADANARGPWWKMFHDPELDALEEQVTSANQSLKASLAVLEQARDETRIARSMWFPTITANASAVRSRVSAYSAANSSGRAMSGNAFNLGASMAWELDAFGRIRNTVTGAHASEQASAGDTAALDLSLHAELAADYFTLRGLDVEQRLLDRTVADYARALDLTQNLYRGGAAPVSDVYQAQAQLETARTQAEDTRLRRAQTEHAIAVLIGREASGFTLEPQPDPKGLPAPPAIAVGLPSELLERRPDVAAAERRVASANAAIGVARAAFSPVFTLPGTIGSLSPTTDTWLTAPSEYWAIGPQAMLTLFDAGMHAAQSAQAHAAYEQQVANYRGTVLTAFQEVEDNLAALRQLQLESVSEAAAVTATQGALEQANLRYKGGIVTYLEVVATENAALAARLAAVDIDMRRDNATVLLIKALGGDWQTATSSAGGG